jgi:hypothetical protein
MKYVFILIVIVHGLIHLMGFAKAFNFATLNQLQQPISPALGLLWLASALLFLASALLFWLVPAWWWLPALAAVVVSQVVIIASWSDAKFGSIANLIVFIPVVVAALGNSAWNDRARLTTPITAWRTVNGHKVPEAEAHWQLPDGEFAYGSVWRYCHH